jgi:DNA topoisomerase-1
MGSTPRARLRPRSIRATLERSGIRRRGGPRNGFHYRCADGAAPSRAQLARIERMSIPPAWRSVLIAASPRARVQAIGLDAAGRSQYLYRASHTRRRSRAKFARLVAFGRALPCLRRAFHRDLSRAGLPREKSVAAALLLLTASAMRPGSEAYAAENRTFGLATLRDSHVEIAGARIRLRFRGKRGVLHRQEFTDRRLARLLAAMKALPGRELIAYVDGDGRARDIRRRDLNDYVKREMGAAFSARDFRTWRATLVCAAALHAERGVAPAERERAIARAVGVTAAWLGNTPAVAREAYIHPALIAAFRAGRVVARPLAHPAALIERRPTTLDPSERALLTLLRRAR